MILFVETVLLVLCAAIAAVGYGSGLCAFLRVECNPGDRGILGLFSFGILGCLLHFVTPLSPAVQWAILAGGIGAAVFLRNSLRHSAAVWAGAGILFLYTLSHPQSDFTYDGGLYYLQTMRWITEHPIVAGLGNLHGRLAFNSMIFPLAGVADRKGLGWVPNMLLVLFVFLSLFVRLRNVTGGGRRSGVAFWVLVLGIFLLATENHSILAWYGVLNADAFTAVLVIYWVCVAVALADSADPAAGSDVAMLVLTAVLAVAVKMSAAPLLLPTALLAWIYRKRLAGPSVWRVGMAASLLLGVWMLRGITLSGCALYPVPETCLSGLPWAETVEQVRAEQLWIRSWARMPRALPGEVLKDGAWMGQWLRGVGRDNSIRLFLIFVPLGLIAALFRREFAGPRARGFLVVTGGLIGCLVFWFATAPDLRFGSGFLLAAALLGGSVALAACFAQPRLGVYLPALLLAYMAIVSVRGLRRGKGDYFHAVSEPAMYALRGPRGIRIFVPKGDADQCWDHPLPCTPYFDSAAVARMAWPASWPVPLSWWSPDEETKVLRKNINESLKRVAERPSAP